jgi:hypothetical protein
MVVKKSRMKPYPHAEPKNAETQAETTDTIWC